MRLCSALVTQHCCSLHFFENLFRIQCWYINKTINAKTSVKLIKTTGYVELLMRLEFTIQLICKNEYFNKIATSTHVLGNLLKSIYIRFYGQWVQIFYLPGCSWCGRVFTRSVDRVLKMHYTRSNELPEGQP